MLRNTREGFGWVTKGLHWSIAVLMIGLLALGYYMVGLTFFDPWYNASLSLHKSLGMTVLALAVINAAWKLYSPSPPLPAAVGGLQRRAAAVVHYLLLLAIVVIPITGYLISTSAAKPVSVFQWFDIPALLPASKTTALWATAAHFYAAYTTAVLIGLHAAAAIKHQFFDGIETLARMIWR